ncbi:MAG: TolC family protein [Bacteroidia bacterium]|nr:TolC family protein [Bacteroidia bacterium]
MKKSMITVAALLFLNISGLFAQDAALAENRDTTAAPTIISLEQALEIALSENVSVKVADMEIKRTGYARKGTYSALYPQVSGSASYQRTIKKQVMYMDFDMSSLTGGAGASSGADAGASSGSGSSSGAKSGGGIEVGRWNTWSYGVSASMPLVNAQLWESLKISDMDVELAVEKARSSRLQTVTQVKQAYFACLLAREVLELNKFSYENAVRNLEQTQKKYNAQRASELDLTRAKTSVANAIPSVYDAESNVILSLWQLKAVMGVDLEANIDIAGKLSDWAGHMLYDATELGNMELDRNSTMRQLAIQAEQLASTIKLQKNANIPTLAASFSYTVNAMTNDFKFSEYNWSPYSFAGLSLSIPIFSGGKRATAIKQARIQANELDLQKANTERQLKISIRQYLNTMDTQMKSYNSALSAIETAEKAFDIAQKSYLVGRSTLTDLDSAELALIQARLSASQSIYSFISAKADLEQVLGADFIDDNGNVQLNNTYDNE